MTTGIADADDETGSSTAMTDAAADDMRGDEDIDDDDDDGVGSGKWRVMRVSLVRTPMMPITMTRTKARKVRRRTRRIRVPA